MAAAAVAVASPPAMAGEAHAQMAAAPTVDSVGSPDANGTYGAGKIIAVTVRFSEPVNVTGTPMLALSTDPPRSAAYAGGSGSSTIEFWYAVEPGDMAARLNYTSASALSLNGGSIVRTADGTTAATLALPLLGSPGSLGGSKAIVIDTTMHPILAAADSATDSRNDNPTDFEALDEARGVATFEEGGITYAIVTAAGPSERAVQLIRVNENGTLSAAGVARDGQGGFWALHGATGIDAFAMGGVAYAIVASEDENAVQLIRIENGTMYPAGTARESIIGNPTDFEALLRAIDVAAFEMNNRTFAIVAAQHESAVQLIQVNEDGTLSANGTARDGQPPRPGARPFEALSFADAVLSISMHMPILHQKCDSSCACTYKLQIHSAS